MPSKIDAQAASARKAHDQLTIPVDVEAIAIGEGIDVVRRVLESNVSGILVRKRGRVVLGINSSNHPRRQRFTIAHELGHYFLHPGRRLTVDSAVRVNRRDDVSSLATDREEIEANTFAASLLMPADRLHEAAASAPSALLEDRTRLAAVLAGTFDVSEEAMNFRLHNLGIAS